MIAYTKGAKLAAKKAKAKDKPAQWSGERPPKAEPEQPTPEQRKQQDYEQSDTGVFINKAPSPLRRAFRSGKLSPEQVAAGEWLEALWKALNGSTGARSCLDWSIPGHSETEPERRVRQESEYKHVRRLMGTRIGTVVHSVCVLHEAIGDCRPTYRRYRMLCEGLDVLVRYREGM